MIVGLDRFREFFRDYQNQYALIGGVATMRWLEEAGFSPRATKDFDLVLLIENLDDAYLRRFWDFVRTGKYSTLQKSTGERIYYRFANPEETDYPFMMEIFSRAKDGMTLWSDQRIVPIPADADASSLSAILMDEDYYAIVRDHTEVRDGLPLLSAESLILLKAKAWLDLHARKVGGVPVDERHIKKHRNDLFKLALLLVPDKAMGIPRSVFEDLTEFLSRFPADSPEWGSIRQASSMADTMPAPDALIEIIAGHYVPV